jgi:hypothetical protein
VSPFTATFKCTNGAELDVPILFEFGHLEDEMGQTDKLKIELRSNLRFACRPPTREPAGLLNFF